MPRPTVYDICARSGVSIATVSRVLNGSPKVSPAAKRRVLDAAYQLGYTPSFAARSLAKQRSDLLGAIFPRMASGFFAEVLCGLDAATKDGGFHLVTAFSHGKEDEQTLAERFVQQRLVAALVLMNFNFSDPFLAHLGENGIPVVSLDGPSPEVSSASIDNHTGIYELLEYLTGLGHRRIAVLLGNANIYDAEQRLAACLEFTASRRLEIPAHWQMPGSFSEQGGYTAVKELLAKGPLPTAIIAFNDLMALGATRALREAGKRVPEDVSVAGFDDVDIAAPFNLTTVHVPMFQLGQVAGEAAVAHLNGHKEPINRIVVPHLVTRGSCARPRARA